MKVQPEHRVGVPPLPLPLLEAWIESVLGPVEMRPTLDYDSQVAVQPDGLKYLIKRAASPRSFQRETYAHSHILSALDPACAPRLIAASHPRLTLITTVLPGIPVTRTRLPQTARADTYRSAGALLAQLHHARRPSPSVYAAARTDLQRTAEVTDRLIALTEPPLSADARAFVTDRITHLRDVTQGIEIGFIHGNFREDSWTRSVATHHLALADFSTSRFAPVLYDLVHIASGWIDQPLLRGSFYRGYGRGISPTERHILTSLITLHAATGLVHNTLCHDERAAGAAQRLLTRLVKGVRL